MNDLQSTLARIKPVNTVLLAQTQARLDNKTKPPGSRPGPPTALSPGPAAR